MGDKLKALIIGPGNIGTDLLMKALRSDHIEPVWMVGIEESEGIKRARDMGLKTSVTGIEGALPSVIEDDVRIAFDATSAYVHAENAKALNALGVIMVDLTPAAIGPFCVPPVNLAQHAEALEMNVNMVTCGGQATIPMVYAVSRCSRWSTEKSLPPSAPNRWDPAPGRTLMSSPAPRPRPWPKSAVPARAKPSLSSIRLNLR